MSAASITSSRRFLVVEPEDLVVAEVELWVALEAFKACIEDVREVGQ
jgi:hypothetical protein